MESVVHQRYKAYVMLLLTGLGWAASTIMIKLYIGSLPPYHLMFGRFSVAFVAIYALFPRKLVRLSRRDTLAALLIGGLIFVAYTFGITTLSYTTASKSGFLVAMSVLFVPIFQVVIHRKISSPWVGVSVLLSIIGLYLIAGLDGMGFNFGDLLAIGCAVFYSFYIMAVDRFGKTIDNVTLVLYQLVTVMVLSLVMSIGFEGFSFQVLSVNSWPILFTGIVGTAVTLYFQNSAQRLTSPESVGLLLLSEPVFTILLAVVLLAEQVTPSGLVGAGLILAAMVLTIVKEV